MGLFKIVRRKEEDRYGIMAKKMYPRIEYMVVALVLFAVLLLVIPFSRSNTMQAMYISKWNEVYNRVDYMFSVMNAHVDDDMLKSLKNAQTTKDKEQILLAIVKPYLRINTDNIPSKFYKPKFKNGSNIPTDDRYYFDEFYFTKNRTIVGIKNIKTLNENDPFFIMMFDINGLKRPNRFGVDIFGINIFDKGKIEPFGYDKTLNALQEDCSEAGTGISCSYYYKIGGEF